MRSLGLVDTEMYGGYELDALGRPAARARRRRSRSASTASRAGASASGRPRSTSPACSAPCGSRAAGWGRCGRRSPGFTPSDARYLLYLLAHVRDPGKIDREVGRLPGVAVLHKAGWIDSARHDNGIVLWPGGALVVTVMTYRAVRRRRLLRRARGRRRGGRACGAFAADVVRRPAEPGARTPVHEMNARERASVRLAVAPSECAAARGVRPREATVREYRAPITETSAARPGFVRVP